jgi:hypothetical protein
MQVERPSGKRKRVPRARDGLDRVGREPQKQADNRQRRGYGRVHSARRPRLLRSVKIACDSDSVVLKAQKP